MDAGFANRMAFLSPFQSVRYHLKDFKGEGRYPEDEQELFNLRHASLRNVIERTFGVLKSRFIIFKTAPPFPYKTQAELVLACVGLHNFLRKECRSDEFPPDPEDLHSANNVENLDDLTDDQEREQANDWRTMMAKHMWEDAKRDRTARLADEAARLEEVDETNDDEA